jgi:hypothetical protein
MGEITMKYVRNPSNGKGFFRFVREAKLIEISAVLMGSNELTPTKKEPTSRLEDERQYEPTMSLKQIKRRRNLI